MSTFILVVGLILLALAVTIILRAFSSSGNTEVVQQIGAYGFRGFVTRDDASDSRGRVTLGELPTTVGTWLSKRFGSRGEAETRRRLIAAGWYAMTPNAFLGYRLLSAIAVSFGVVVLVTLASAGSIMFAIGIVIGALFGWYLPSIILNRRTMQRNHLIERELPELIDLLVVTVEAGIGFSGALRLAAAELTGPLAQELR